MKAFGIDVSAHNGKVNWNKVKQAGNDFVMIRAGWTWYEGGMNIDTMFYENIEGALAAGLDVGVYIYAYDKTPKSAVQSARKLIEVLQPYKGKITFPVAYDVEETADRCLLNQGKEGLTETCSTFLSTLEQAGYYATLYTYTYFMPNLNMERLKSFDLWLADYRDPTGTNCLYNGEFGMWQYKGNNGRCDGVIGGCDLNIAYKDYALLTGRRMPASPTADYKALYTAECSKTTELKAKLQEINKISTL